MPAHRIRWSWSPSTREERAGAARSLKERLRECSLDRAASSIDVTLEAATLTKSWLADRPRGWGHQGTGHEDAGFELELGWREWVTNHGWRGVCSKFVDGVRAALHRSASTQDAGSEELLREELGQVLEGWLICSEEESPAGAERLTTPTRRLVAPESVVPHALRSLERHETILLSGYSETVLACLGGAQQGGLYPEVVVGLGAADQSGKRMARQLASLGIGVRLLWDTAVLGAVHSVDRIWLGTEAVGSTSFVGLVGTGLLISEAARHEVPVNVICTSDKLMPAGITELPGWGELERWNLWSHGPEEVRVESQPYELTDADCVRVWITEEGPESLATICTRSMRTSISDPCTPRQGS